MTIFQIPPWVSFSQIESVRSLIIYFLLKNSWHNSNWKLCSSSINYHWFSCDNNGCPTRFDFTEMKSIQLAIQAQIILLIGLKYFRNSSSHFFIGDRKWEISSKVEINRFGSHCWEFMTTRFQLEFVLINSTFLASPLTEKRNLPKRITMSKQNAEIDELKREQIIWCEVFFLDLCSRKRLLYCRMLCAIETVKLMCSVRSECVHLFRLINLIIM